MAKFVQDRDSQATKDTVTKAQAEATKLGLSFTPSVFMNGVLLEGLELNSNYIKKVIEDKLKELNVSPINQ